MPDKIKLAKKLPIRIIHSLERWNAACQATIPEYWEAEVLNIPEEILSDENPCNLHIYGTSRTSEVEAVEDLVAELESFDIIYSIKIIR